MTIEALLERIAVAAEKRNELFELALAKAVPGGNQSADAPAEAAKATSAKKSTGKNKPAAVTQAERDNAADAEVVDKKAAPKDDFLDEKKGDVKELTEDDVRAKLQAYAAANNADGQGTTRAKALIEEVAKVKKIADIPKEKYRTVVVAVDKKLAAPKKDDAEEL